MTVLDYASCTCGEHVILNMMCNGPQHGLTERGESSISPCCILRPQRNTWLTLVKASTHRFLALGTEALATLKAGDLELVAVVDEAVGTLGTQSRAAEPASEPGSMDTSGYLFSW